MKILIRTGEKKDWEVVGSIKPKAEIELQNLLIESPSLIPVDEIREDISSFLIAVDEFGLPGSGNTDVLAFNSEGDIAIVECKLAANPESKRKVVGQILEYGAHLWEMDYETLNERIKKKKGKSLSQLIEDAIGKESAKAGEKGEATTEEPDTRELNEENFRSRVEEQLKTGSFLLIIVVDEINEELKKIVRYVNECGKPTFSFHALEMNRFQSANVEILVPYLYGAPTKPLPTSRRKPWTEKEFIDVLTESVPDIVGIVTNLYEWAKSTAKGVGGKVVFGTGIETGSFTFHFIRDGETFSVFSVLTNGRLILNYGWLSNKVSQETMEGFHKRLQEIPTFKQIPSDFSKWASIRIADAFKDSENIGRFEQVVIWLGNEIQASMRP